MPPPELDPKERYSLPPQLMGSGEAIVATTIVSSPPPTASKVDRLYRQLMEIHTICAA
jgi:hypothetical protein